MARELASFGWRCEGYHAGKMQPERQRIQAEFMSGQLQVVVATVAFGLGVNKSDVRVVVHSGLPRSVEAWVQETGRAGRDGRPATCVALVCEDDFRRLHSQCHRDGIGYEQLRRMLTQLLSRARNGYGELPHKQMETKLDMTREVAQTVLALLTELPPSAWRVGPAPSTSTGGAATSSSSGGGGEEDDAGDEDAARLQAQVEEEEAAAMRAEDEAAAAAGPLIELLPEIRRVALLSFHQQASPPEVVASHSPLVEMLLSSAKETNGSFKCQLIPAAAALSMDAHEAHAELAQLHACGVLRLELSESAFYVRVRRVPSPKELDALTAHLLRRVEGIEQLATTKLKAAARVLWTLADRGAEAAAGGGEEAAGGADEAHEQRSVQELLEAYFLDDTGGSDLWARVPFKLRGNPYTLRGDVLDFVSTYGDELGKSGAPLTGRAVARILHRLPSPSFTKKDWEKNRFWGLHREVDFEVLQRLADEQIETARRRSLVARAKQQPARKRAREQ